MTIFLYAGDVDYAYEYVYYYYDEDGKNGTVVDTKSASSLIKLNNISVVELPVVAPVSSGTRFNSRELSFCHSLKFFNSCI